MSFPETSKETVERIVTDETDTIDGCGHVPIVKVCGVELFLVGDTALPVKDLRRELRKFIDEQRKVGRSEALATAFPGRMVTK